MVRKGLSWMIFLENKDDIFEVALCKFEGFLFGDFWVKNGILKR